LAADSLSRPNKGGRIDVATDELAKLASAIERQTAADGAYDTAAPSELVALVYEPSLCVVAQGAKEVLLADETCRLDPAQFLLVSVHLPVAASPRQDVSALKVEAQPTH
jgi:hypothetical protein